MNILKKITINKIFFAAFLCAGVFLFFIPKGFAFMGGRSGEEKPFMVYIPGATFWMGADETDGIIGAEIGVAAMPKHKVKLKSYYIDKFEVTVEEYREFIKALNKKTPIYWTSLPKEFVVQDDLPAFGISWYEADQYCKWAGKRLPSEAEWEYAARGETGYLWPWGKEFNRSYLNIATFNRDNWIIPVGSIPENVSPFGVYDMAGNIFEWTEDLFELYPGSKLKKRRAIGVNRILRGGGWTSLKWMANSINRMAIDPQLNQPDFGFRCAKGG